MPPSHSGFIPTDIFYAVLEHLTDRRDLYATALANRDFNRAATPLLYRTLDTDTRAGQWGHKTVRSFQLCSA
jgi:F-box-like